MRKDKLTSKEKKWMMYLIKKMEKPEKKIALRQLRKARIKREYDPFYIFVDFVLPQNVERLPFSNGVPAEMWAKWVGPAPMVFLLHVEDGLLKELEVYNADLSEVEIEYPITKWNTEVRVEKVVEENGRRYGVPPKMDGKNLHSLSELETVEEEAR